MWTKCSKPPTPFTRVEIKDRFNNKYLGYYTGAVYLESEGHKLIKSPKYWRYLPKKQRVKINIQEYFTPRLALQDTCRN